MDASDQPARHPISALPKTPTGIEGFDEITFGGLPAGRPTLVFGNAGSGKTLFGIEFLVRGATRFNEPGVIISFEETGEELASNVASLGFDLPALIEQQKLAIDHVFVERSEIQETGEFDLEALFVRMGYAIDSVGARRVLLDSVESLFSGLPNETILRAELRRLFRWLKARGVTAVITGEKGNGTLTRHGLEEYISDCVIMLDHRIVDQVAIRRLRILKYRGSMHGTNEFPFLIGDRGFSILPLSSVGLNHRASGERVPAGVSGIDEMLGGKGFYRGSTVLVSGSAGTGKSSIAAKFAVAASARGERCLYLAMEESEAQILRNMCSIGIDLKTWIDRGLLKISAERPTEQGLEMHLAMLHREVADFQPRCVVIDPITNLTMIGSPLEIKAMLTRVVDFLKMNQITALFTSLTTTGASMEQTEVGISSVIDTWILLRSVESAGERNRFIYVLKSRGMAHSNQVRGLRLGDNGVSVLPAPQQRK